MDSETASRHFAIITQVYPPDPAAVGQHLADVACELSHQGHRVTVITADRGYDDPSVRFPRFESCGNITVLRLPFCSFGKGSIRARMLSGLSLLAQASALTLPNWRLTDLLISTIPHFAGALGVAATFARHVKFHYWLMDLNPDQIVAIGKLAPDALPVKALDWLNRLILRRASTIVTLDTFMAQRFSAKSGTFRKITVQPPWSLDNGGVPLSHSENPFRARFNLQRERIIMYAGNHSVVHPMDTLLHSIARCRDLHLSYFFVGCGIGKRNVEDWLRVEQLRQVILLPYQERSDVHAMLCAADVHVVSVGNETVGIVHPSKLYGALAAGRPLLVLGPAHSPAAQLVKQHALGWHIEHGDIDEMCRILREIAEMPDGQLDGLQQRALHFGKQYFSKSEAVANLCAEVLC